MSDPTTLLIDQGDASSLALVALQPDAEDLIIWHPRHGGRSSMGESKAAQHTHIFGTQLLVHDIAPIAVGNKTRPELAHSRILTEAAFTATALGCTRVLSPIQVGPDHVKVSHALNRACVVTRLIDVGGDDREIIIDLPLIDLTDEQVVELIDDAGAPLDHFWPCEHDRKQPCDTCSACERWQRAFDALQILWPWSYTAVTS